MTRPESPYRLPPRWTDRPALLRKQQAVIAEQQRRLQELPARPPTIGFFEQRLISAPTAPKRAPRIGLLCQFAPPELVWAAGGEAVRFDCGNSAAVMAGEELVTGDICPLVKATLGQVASPAALPNSCDAWIVPASCDAKKKLAEWLADYKPVFPLPLPPTLDSARYSTWVVSEFERLADFIASITHRRIRRQALQAALALGNQRAALIRRLHEARLAQPGAMSLQDAFLLVQSSLFSPEPIETWIPEAEMTIRHAEAFRASRHRLRPRLVLTGAPIVWPNFKPIQVLEECGADVVSDTLCTGLQTCADPARTDESSMNALLRALAARSVFGSLCPCFTDATNRFNRVLDLVERTHARGVVHYALRLCQPFDLETGRLEQLLKARGIPLLTLRTDYSLEDTEQLRVRVEAFLETLV